jgi:2-oxoglutarate ferredoxin oxidoreductase subunit alpha
VQEAVDLTGLAFDLAEKYRSVVCILMDGYLGQMMEPVELPPFAPLRTKAPSWAVGAKHPEGERAVLTSINISPPMQEIFNVKMESRWQQIEEEEVRYKGYYLDDAEYVVVGFGTAGRIALTSVRAARAKGIKVGLLRPITVSPFPVKELDNLVPGKKGVLVVEMNNGQMLDDVSAIVAKRVPVHFYGRMGGMVPYPDEIDAAIDEMIHSDHDVNRDARGVWLAKMRELVGTGA